MCFCQYWKDETELQSLDLLYIDNDINEKKSRATNLEQSYYEENTVLNNFSTLNNFFGTANTGRFQGSVLNSAHGVGPETSARRETNSIIGFMQVQPTPDHRRHPDRASRPRLSLFEASSLAQLGNLGARSPRHVLGPQALVHHDGFNRSCSQDGVAGVAQGRKECQRQHRAKQPNGAYCLRLWYVPRCFWTAVPDFKAEHMGGMFENARKPALSNYQSILRNIHEKPSIIAQTHNPSAENRPVVALRALYLCLQCPSIMTETDRDQHFETKSHCFCGLQHD
jgi:hypothetical protein